MSYNATEDQDVSDRTVSQDNSPSVTARDLTDTQRLVLRCVAVVTGRPGDTIGADICEEYAHRRSESHKTIYNHLIALEDHGLIECATRPADARSNAYNLSPAGEALLVDALAAFEADVGHLAGAE